MKRKKINYKEVAELEYLNGMTLKDLEKKYNISKWTFLKNFKKLGIRKVNKINKNENSFATFTTESCYWAGFIAADGCIGKYQLSIELSKTDENHLKKFIKFIKTDLKIKYRNRIRNNKIYKYCSVNISSKKIVEDLKNNFNIVPNKSLILKPPYKIPNNLIVDYIRGNFDGDGSVGWHKYNNKIRMCFISGSFELIEWIYNNLPEKVKIKKNKNLYSINYVGKKAKRILNWMYDNPIEYLNRKYIKQIELIKKMDNIKQNRDKKRNDFINTTKKLNEHGLSIYKIADQLNVTVSKVVYFLKDVCKLKPNYNKYI